MAIKVGGTTVIDNSRNVDNIGTIKGLTYPSSDGTAGQFLKTDGAGTLAFQTVESDPTKATLTKTFSSGESASLTLSTAITSAPVVGVIKEVPQVGVSSKGSWDVNATASNYELHDTAYSTTLTPSTIGYGDISAATYTNSSLQPPSANDGEDFYIREDGLKFYILDNGFKNIREWTLSTANDLTTATYVQDRDFSGSGSITGFTDPVGFTFKPDGTKMYVVDYGNDIVGEVNLSTAWDISTAVFSQSFSISSQTGGPASIAFKSDGTRMYVMSGGGVLFQYDLSTAWDVSTAAYNSVSLSGHSTWAYALTFSSTGDRIYSGGDGSDQDISVHTLSTAWDISTATRQTGEDLNVLSQTGQYNYAVQFTNNGQNMYVYGNNSSRRIYKYSVPANDVLTLGSGSFASTDVGKNIKGNGGDVILTSAAGAYDATGGSNFTDSSTIASGSWTMSGIKSVGDANGLGISYLFNGYASPNFWSYDNSSLSTQSYLSPTPSSGHQDFYIKPDGTSIYITNTQQREIYQIDLSTPYDLSTASFAANVNMDETASFAGIFFKPDGTKMYIIDLNGNTIRSYTLSTPWDLSTESYDSTNTTLTSHNSAFGCFFKPDGTSFYVTSSSQDNVRQYDLSTAWDVSSISMVGTFQPQAGTGVLDVFFKPDGTVGYVVMNNDLAREFTLSTAWDITTASDTGNTFSFASQDGDARGLFMSNDGSKAYMLDNGAGCNIYQYSSGSTYTASGAYHIAVTNSGGQIDTEYWTDINTMTADEAANSGTVHYAVSTDGRTTWSVIKDGDGVRPIVRDNTGTWQYNTAVGTGGYGFSNTASYDSVVYNFSGLTSQVLGLSFKPDGTKLYMLSDASDQLIEVTLSTAFDITTASYSAFKSLSGETNQPRGIQFKPDGTRFFITDNLNDRIAQYNLTTAWDITTASHVSSLFTSGKSESSPTGIDFNNDGTKIYWTGTSTDTVYQYSLSTAYDVSTATDDNKSFSLSTQMTAPSAIRMSSDGYKMFVATYAAASPLSGGYVFEYDLETAYDISTASYSGNSLNLNNESTDGWAIEFKPDGTKMYVSDYSGTHVYQYTTLGEGYSTSTTWTNATTNDEFYALQEALNATSVNRMNKTQLDAVTDPNHYTLGDTLDLMIALRVDSQTSDVPTADGVTINYDAATLNQGAVLGTDYDYDFPDSTTVRITSNAAQNLKIRVV